LLVYELYFCMYFSKKYSNIHLYEIRPVELELFHVSGQTDTTKPIIALRNFAKVVKMIGKLRCYGTYGVNFVTEVSTFWMKVLSLSCTRDMDTTGSSEYLALYMTPRGFIFRQQTIRTVFRAARLSSLTYLK